MSKMIYHDKQLFTALTENSEDAIMCISNDGTILNWNNGATRIYGYSADEVIGHSANIFMIGPCAAGDWSAIRRTVSEGVVQHYEAHHVSKSGKALSLSVTYTPLRNSVGAVVGICSIAHDIAIHREAAAELDKAVASYRLLLDQASDAILVAYPYQKFVEVNRSACQMLGYTREELMQLSGPDLVLPENLAAHPPRIAETADGNILYTERPLRHKDGSVVITECSSTQLDDGRIVSILRDITKRKQIESELESARELYYKLFATSPFGVILSRASDDLLVEANDALLAILEVSREDVIGQSTSSWTNTLINGTVREQLRDLVRTYGKVEGYELEFRTPSGKPRNGLLSVAMLTIGGIPHFVTVVADITAQKENEERVRELAAQREELVLQLLNAQEAERRRIALDLHDGPLQSIGTSILAADRAIRRAERNEPEMMFQELQMLKENLRITINELRAILADVALDTLTNYGLIGALQSHAKRITEETGIKVEINTTIADRLPSRTELLLYRLAQEALANVRKHSQATRASVDIHLDKGSNRALMTVSDNGTGLDLEQATMRSGHGKGVGLGSMHERIRGAGGELEISSTQGQGTVLKFWCPTSSLPI